MIYGIHGLLNKLNLTVFQTVHTKNSMFDLKIFSVYGHGARNAWETPIMPQSF